MNNGQIKTLKILKSANTITYYLPYGNNITLNIFDLQGQLVKTLLNGYKTLGTHTVNWDRKNLGSGMYSIRLTAGENRVSKNNK